MLTGSSFPSCPVNPASVLKGTRKRYHISPILASLHWVHVKLNILFKILLLTYKVSYLTDPIVPYYPNWAHHSLTAGLIVFPRIFNSIMGGITFSFQWNQLPVWRHTLSLLLLQRFLPFKREFLLPFITKYFLIDLIIFLLISCLILQGLQPTLKKKRRNWVVVACTAFKHVTSCFYGQRN